MPVCTMVPDMKNMSLLVRVSGGINSQWSPVEMACSGGIQYCIALC